MEFAPEKCQVLTITRKWKKNIIMKDYKIHDHCLDRVNSAKYLGVTLDKTLNFNAHINSICTKANSTRQFLQRTLSRCSRQSKSQAYTTFVRPIVEYGSTVWDPHNGNQSQATRLESVQNKAVRFVCSDWRRTASVSGMRVAMHWETLQERRAKARLYMLYKISHSLVAIPLSLFPYTSTFVDTRGAPTKFVNPHSNTSAYRSTFMVAAPFLWNHLPPGTSTAPDLEAFRRALPAACFVAARR